jgi:hypothetical protein
VLFKLSLQRNLSQEPSQNGPKLCILVPGVLQLWQELKNVSVIIAQLQAERQREGQATAIRTGQDAELESLTWSDVLQRLRHETPSKTPGVAIRDRCERAADLLCPRSERGGGCRMLCRRLVLGLTCWSCLHNGCVV